MDRALPCPESDVLLNALLNNCTDGIYFKDRYCRFVRLNPRIIAEWGFRDEAELIGKNESDLFGEEVGRRAMLEDLQVMESGEPRLNIVESRLRPDGSLHWISVSKFPLRDGQGKVVGLLGIVRAVDEVKRMEADVQFFATHDSLTELPNRSLLTDRLEQCIARALRQQTVFAVLYLDLNDFRHVNEAYGYKVGDQVLHEIARRIRATIRRSDTVARIGGDEFVILLEGVQNSLNALRVAEKIQQSVEQPLQWNAQTLHLSPSIGISLFPEHATEATLLLQLAEGAMYAARRRRKACLVAPRSAQRRANTRREAITPG